MTATKPLFTLLSATMATMALLVLLATSAAGFAPTRTVVQPSHASLGFSLRSSIKEEPILLSESDEQVLFDNGSIPRRNGRNGRNGSRTNRPTNFPPPINNPLDTSANPLVNNLKSMRETVSACPYIWKDLSTNMATTRAILDDHLCDTKVDLTFGEMEEQVRKSAALFRSLGVGNNMSIDKDGSANSNVAILGENSAKWLIVDHGIQLAGGVSAVRGADAPLDELRYIYEHSDSCGVVVLQDVGLLKKLGKDAEKMRGDWDEGLASAPLGLYNRKFGGVTTVILLHKGKTSTEEIEALGKEYGVKIMVLSEALDKLTPVEYGDLPQLTRDDLSTIVYTSGTTGRPKGVMLTHGNLLHQTTHRLSPSTTYDTSEPLPGELMLSLLPVWHITERTFELYMLTRGCHVVYSGIRWFKNDLAKHQPQWMVLVPRVLEKVALGVQDKFSAGSAVVQGLVKLFTKTSTLKHKHRKLAKGLVVGKEQPTIVDGLISRGIVMALAPLNFVGDKLVWKKVRAGFGGRQKVIISGGSALAGGLETFYENCGIDILVGYGLTECAPLLAHRRTDQNLITAGCVGFPAGETEIRVVDPEAKGEGEREALPDGLAGLVIGRGPQVMRGYYKNEEATNKAIDRWGWFDTGDLGRINPATGDLILTGRAKDTIVLSNGENIEPQPIEDAILSESKLVEQVMLTGQDGRSLIAIAVLNPNELVNSDFLSEADAKSIIKDYEIVNDPKCNPEDCKEACQRLTAASDNIRKNASLVNQVTSDVKGATTTSAFRKWEQVNSVYVTLEPFAMANGLLTQSYKVKRDFVARRYEDELP